MKSKKIITHAEIIINPEFLQEILPKAKEREKKYCWKKAAKRLS